MEEARLNQEAARKEMEQRIEAERLEREKKVEEYRLEQERLRLEYEARIEAERKEREA